jgi:hypothetical protein
MEEFYLDNWTKEEYELLDKGMKEYPQQEDKLERYVSINKKIINKGKHL